MDHQLWLDRLAARLQQQGAIRSPALADAFRRVPRHRLIERYFRHTDNGWIQQETDPADPRPEDLERIYADSAIVTRLSPSGIPSSSTSQAGLVAYMLELLGLQPGMKVLEIGTGTGYNAALLSELVGDQHLVTSIDIQADVVAQARRLLAGAGYPNVRLVCGDGFTGVAAEAPYDRIVVTAGCPDLSPHWATQLKPDGAMLVPLQHGGWHPLTRVWPEDDWLAGKIVGDSGFMSLQGELDVAGPWPYTHPYSFAGKQVLPAFAQLEPDFFPHVHYFMALQDRRTFRGWPAICGLVDDHRGTVALNFQTSEVLLDGDADLFPELQGLYTAWQELGQPCTRDYALYFQPLADPSPQPSTASWIIERHFYREVASLSV